MTLPRRDKKIVHMKPGVEGGLDKMEIEGNVFAAPVIDGIKRKSRICVGESIVGKTRGRRCRFSIGSKDRACDGKDRADHGRWQGRIHTRSHRCEQHGDGFSEDTTQSTQEDEASESWPDYSVRSSTRDRRLNPKVQALMKDCNERYNEL